MIEAKLSGTHKDQSTGTDGVSARIEHTLAAQPLGLDPVTLARLSEDASNVRGDYGALPGKPPAIPVSIGVDLLEHVRDLISFALRADAGSIDSGDLGRAAALVKATRRTIDSLPKNGGSLAGLEEGSAALATLLANLGAAGNDLEASKHRLRALLEDPAEKKGTKGAARLLLEELGNLSESCAAFGGPDIGRPASTLPRFSVSKLWDADSTPPWLASVSRVVGAWAPNSGGRTPEIEAGVVMASLMHDVAYYYGGWITDKERADKLFGDQIPFFTAKLDPDKASAAKVTAKVDVAAVALAGGPPFQQSYSWSYGFEPPKRGYATLDPGQNELVLQIAREVFKEVVHQIAAGTFEVSSVLAAKLGRTSPAYQAAIKANIIELACSLQRDFERGDEGKIPGFAAP